jgi:hypothetical protein
MRNSDRKIQALLTQLMDFLVPAGMTRKERLILAERAGISGETLRKNIQRKSLNADTLIRLLLARGVSPETLLQLPQSEFSELSKGETVWLELGRKLTDNEKSQYAELIEYIRIRWNLRK